MSDSDDDVPALSAHTLAALQEFYNETSTGPAPSDQFAVGALEEDWVSLLDSVTGDSKTDTASVLCFIQ